MAPHSSEYYVDLKLNSVKSYELIEDTSEHMNTWILHMKHTELCGYNNRLKLPSYCKPTQPELLLQCYLLCPMCRSCVHCVNYATRAPTAGITNAQFSGWYYHCSYGICLVTTACEYIRDEGKYQVSNWISSHWCVCGGGGYHAVSINITQSC